MTTGERLCVVGRARVEAIEMALSVPLLIASVMLLLGHVKGVAQVRPCKGLGLVNLPIATIYKFKSFLRT